MLALAACQSFASTVYVECEWEAGIPQPASQTIEFYSGLTRVQSATVTKADGWRAEITVSKVFDNVKAVAESDTLADVSIRDYGCKPYRSLVLRSDMARIRRTASGTGDFETYNGDWVGSFEIMGWSGWTTVSGAESVNAKVYVKPASSGDPIYVVYNTKLPSIEYSATGYDGYYDGLNHGISVSVSTSGATVEYSTTGTGGWTTTNPLYKDVGEYTVYFRITKSGYMSVTDSQRVRILDNKDISLESFGYTGLYDGAWHSITVRVKTPSSGARVQYSMDGKTGWTTTNPSFLTGTNTVYYKVTATGYNTREGSETVAIANRTMTCSATGWAGPYDGYAHSVYAYPSSAYPPTSYTVYYSLDGTSWRTGNYGFAQLGTYTVYCKIRATGYDESNVATARVTIWEAAMTDGTIPGIVTDEIEYTGKKPWPDNPGYYKFIWGDWELCKWRVGEWTIEIEGDGAYTGKVSKVITVRPKSAWIISGGAQKEYDGEPLEYDRVDWGGFVDGEGVESAHAFGSQTDVGYSPNYFTYTLKTGTDPANYYLNVTTNRLTVIGANPVSLKYPAKLDITGPDTVNASVSREFKAWATYSDGTSNLVDSVWTLFPGEPDARLSSYDGSRVTLTPLPAGAGDELVLGASWQKEVGYSSVADGLVAWYPVNSWSVQDYSVYNRTGVGTNLSLVADRTEGVDGAFRFYGKDTGSMIEVAGAPSPLDGVTNAFTLAAWICPQAGESDYPVVYRGDQLSLSVSSAGVWSFCGKTLATSKKVSAGEWHHVALVWDGRKATAYLDAVKAGETSFMENRAVSTEPLRFGRVGDKWYSGDLDDMRIYSRVISASEVVTIKNGRDVTATTAIIKVEAEKVVNVPDTTTIPIAVDTQNAEGRELFSPAFSFTTGSTGAGGAGWFGQYKTVYGIYDETDYDAAQSGKIPHGGTSWMQTKVTGAGIFSFWWRTESEPTYDYMVFTDNGEELARISGTNGWKWVVFDFEQKTHNLRWEYVKDGKKSIATDAAWVDRIEWTVLNKPALDWGVSSLVEATDGMFDDRVYITWGVPSPAKTITGYQVFRNGVAISDVLMARTYTDLTAQPGVIYSYEVKARNPAGWGSCGKDSGHRGVFLRADPLSCCFSNDPTNETVSVSVESNANWKVQSNKSWIKVKKTSGGFDITATKTTESSMRFGKVTITGGIDAKGNNLDKPKYVDISVAQSASIDLKFAKPQEDWRTELLVTTNGTEDVVSYSPVSVFDIGEDVKISFGFENKSKVEVEIPAVEFRVYSMTNVVMKWKDTAPDRMESRYAGAGEKKACGFWSGEHLKALPCGDYKLVAFIDPDNLMDDPDRSNNTAYFRFAVRNPGLEAGVDVFDDGNWSNFVFEAGNDYAQPPHIAFRNITRSDGYGGTFSYEDCTVQFGPYVPMNGLNGTRITVKKPVDIVLLVDFTGSMDTCIIGLMNNIGAFIDRLLLGDPKAGISPIEDLRIKIAGFSDYGIRGDGSDSDCRFKNWFVETPFTTNRKQLKENLEALREQCYGGGGNAGESSYDALYYLAKGWSTVWDEASPSRPDTYVAVAGDSAFRDAGEAARAVVVFTDEPPHVPLTAPGCAGVTLEGLDEVLREADIQLTIIGDGDYYGSIDADYRANAHWHGDLVALAEGRKLEETSGTGTLAEFTQDTSRLQALAKIIYEQVPTEAVIVEPYFSATAHGEGTLEFLWCNDSAAGTNNILDFSCEGVTNMTRASDRTWVRETLRFEDLKIPDEGEESEEVEEGEMAETGVEPDEAIEPARFAFPGEGTHIFKWKYHKTNYDPDATVDCGAIAGVRWTPAATSLHVTPDPAVVDYLGTNEVQTVRGEGGVKVLRFGATYKVRCNTVWKVAEEGRPDWIHFVQDNGDGDGTIVITVDENETYAIREGSFTVVAGEYGLESDDIKTEEVGVVQNAHPYVETDSVQILRVDVKPRWPWNELVDIDFLVVQPKDKTPDEKILVSLVGINEEGGDLIENYGILKDLRECAPRDGSLITTNSIAIVSRIGKTNLMWPSGFLCSNDTVYAICETTGIHRITWKSLGADWKNKEDALFKSLKDKYGNSLISSYEKPFRGENNGFHTPSFAVRLTAQCRGTAESFTSNPVRVDTRVGKSAEQSTSSWSGGAIIFGTEMVGHPDGAVDPVPYDSTTNDNGWVSLDFVEKLPEVWSNCTTKLCVLNNNNVFIEGGTITNSQTWKSGEVHVVRDNVFVDPAKGYLTIEDGAIVKFCFATTIYVHDNESDDYLNRHNILVKGAHFCSAYDQTYGSNTLYSAHSTTESKGGANWVRSEGYSDEVFYGTETWQSSRYHKAILQIKLKTTVKDPETGVVSTSEVFKERYYSRGQEFGNLPRVSRPGTQFYGWFSQSPDGIFGKNLDGSEYTAKKVAEYGVVSTNIAYSTDNSIARKRSSDNKYIYGLLCPTNWSDTVLCEEMDVESAGIVTIYPEEVVYDGRVHAPAIDSIMLGSFLIPASVYSVDYGEDYPEGYVTAGVYKVKASFTSTYVNSPEAMFKVLQRPVAKAKVSILPESTLFVPKEYAGKAYGGVDEPRLEITLEGMGERGAEGPVPSSDYRIEWRDPVAWERGWPGEYAFDIVFNDNYSGKLTRKFTIKENPGFWFDSARYSVSSATAAMAKAREEGKLVFYFCGETNDLETAYVKNLITKDIAFNEWVVENFTCWHEFASDEGSSYAKYASGMLDESYPLICVINPDEPDMFIMRHAGYIGRADLEDFLRTSLGAPVDISPASVTVKEGRDELVYSGREQHPSEEDLVIVYAEKTIVSDDYMVITETESVDVGEYLLKARMKEGVKVAGFTVTGETSSVSYSILPREVTDANYAGLAHILGVKLVSDAYGDYSQPSYESTVYNGEVQRPAVMALLEGVRCDYGTDDWCNAGEHALAVSFSGNYTGTITRKFVIAARDVTGSAHILIDRDGESIRDGSGAIAYAPKVLRVYDDDGRVYIPGVDYDIVWGDGWSDGAYRKAGDFTVTAKFKGNYSGKAEAAFSIVLVAWDGETDSLAVLGDDADPKDVADAIAAIDWTDKKVKSSVTNATEYAAFRNWVEAIGLDEGKIASHAYVSYRLSEFLAVARNLESVDGLEIEVNGFTLAETGSGTEMSVVVSIKKDETPYEFSTKLEDVRKAFAKAIRRSAKLGELDSSRVSADEVQAESVPGDGTKMKLKIAPPAGESGFLKMKLD